MTLGVTLNGEPVPIAVPPVAWLYHVIVPKVQVAVKVTVFPATILVGVALTPVGIGMQGL